MKVSKVSKVSKGQKFSNWTVTKDQEFYASGGAKIECSCSCGTVKLVRYNDARYNKTRSCGCLKRQLYRQTCLEKYGIDDYSKTLEYREKVRKTNLKKFGTEWASQADFIQEKVIKTNLERLGVERPSQSEEVREKAAETSLRKYGKRHYFQTTQGLTQRRKTCLEKYGVEYYLQTEEKKEKSKLTCLKKYGVEFPCQDPTIARDAAKARNKATIKYHWKTKEELVCVASYEAKVVNYLNKLKINYEWHPKTFSLSTGRKYTPDLYLVDQDLWIEIKGYFLDLSFEKWTEFHTKIQTNSELWDTQKLKQMNIL